MTDRRLDMSGMANECAFCDYLAGMRPYTILQRTSLAASLITREQRGVGHVLVIPIQHRATLMDLHPGEDAEVMALLVKTAKAIVDAFAPPGLAVWQNNGAPARQTIPHAHFHAAGTLPGGGTQFGEVRELSLQETEAIAERLRLHLS